MAILSGFWQFMFSSSSDALERNFSAMQNTHTFCHKAFSTCMFIKIEYAM